MHYNFEKKIFEIVSNKAKKQSFREVKISITPNSANISPKSVLLLVTCKFTFICD